MVLLIPYVWIVDKSYVDIWSVSMCYIACEMVEWKYTQSISSPKTKEVKRCTGEDIDALTVGDTSDETKPALQKWDRYATNHPGYIHRQDALRVTAKLSGL